jgi:hypothetical protein
MPETDGLLIALRGQESSLRAFEQHVIAAKQLGMPVLIVDAGSERSGNKSPYLGNVPEVTDRSRLPSVLRAAVVEHLRHQYFHRSSSKLIESTGLPLNTAIIAKAPELLDDHGGVLSGSTSRVVLHPDPPLPPKERELFSKLFARLVSTYDRTVSSVSERLRLFLPDTSSLREIPEDVECIARHMAESKDLPKEAAFSPNEARGLPPGAFVSDMRRLMVREIDALVVVGGKSTPTNADVPGYGGRFPGVAEEVLRAIHLGHPVYVCGGLGGNAARIAELLEVPESLGDFWSEAKYADNAEYMKTVWDFDHFVGRAKLQLPPNLTAMAKVIRDFALELGDDDSAWYQWNGLTRAQNEQLWRTSHPGLLSALIADGLVRWRGIRSVKAGRYSVEVIRGDVTDITRADVLAIPVFSDVDPQGAGAAVDQVTGGAVRQRQAQPNRLLGLQSEQLDVDYLVVASLGAITELDEKRLRPVITSSIRKAIDECIRQGFTTLGLVTFGGSAMESYVDAVSAMLEGFKEPRGNLTIKWVERDERKFNTLVETLRNHQYFDVTTVVQPMLEPTWQPYSWFHVTVHYGNEKLSVTALPTTGNGLAWSNEVSLSMAELERLSTGGGWNGRQTPDLAELRRRGEQLAQLMLGDQAGDFFRATPDAKIAITHDAASSRLPFETLRLANPGNSDTSAVMPAIRGGIHRRLAITGARVEQVLSRPKLSGKLRVGLVIDPTNDLPGARREGEHLRRQLTSVTADFQIASLEHPHATMEGVQDLLRSVDVLHFCGHAQFNPNSPETSGLILSDGILTSEHLRLVSPVPRVTIFNACEAGRVRAQAARHVTDAYSLAEFVLRAGVEAFVGTFWEVSDTAAAEFAVVVYTRLLAGDSLRDAVTMARRGLAENGRNDWANYLLYGDGRLRFA